jgi:pyridoxal phosphate enzyme (YggS family)
VPDHQRHSAAIEVARRVAELRQRVAASCASSGRPEGAVTIIAACKGFGSSHISAARDCGIIDFGENYLQEALSKRPDCPPNLVWHYIGRLQSNKLRRIVGHFDWVHTLDRAEHVEAFAGAAVNALIEVNIAEEPQKAGVLPGELAKFVENVYHLPGVRFRGLMTMGPANRNPEDTRPYFIKMRRLLEGLGIREADCLSMGMSSDFEVAIQEGATHIRIGSGVFGPRPTKDGGTHGRVADR